MQNKRPRWVEAAPGQEIMSKMPSQDQDWPVTRLSPTVTLVTVPAPAPVSAAIESRIEAIWQAALITHPRLYNGRVFCARSIRPDRIDGFWAEYRHVLAQMRKPSLFETLRLRSLAVTGLLLTADGIVLGRRSAHVVYQPGRWQGVPAGSVESRTGAGNVDLKVQLMAEITEELGLEARQVAIGDPGLTCEHATTHIVDVAMPLHTSLSFAEVEACWRAKGNDEYDALTCLATAGTALARTDILPTTRAMIEAFHA